MSDFENQNVQKEEWRRLSRYPEYYVSSLGKVKRINGYEPYCTVLHGPGYERLRIWCEEDDRYYSRYTHELVAEAFLLPAPLPSFQRKIRHKNGVLTDNRVSNLEWVDSAKEVFRRVILVNIPYE